jgi:SAM-dependent methyltransferase
VSTPAVAPARTIDGRSFEGRGRLTLRWTRFAIVSARRGDWDFVTNAIESLATLAVRSFADIVRPANNVTCNICNWTGRRFYPNTGPGYHELDTTCPGCRGIDRHRSLLALMTACTDMFSAPRRAIEVAPMRGFEQLCVAQPQLEYVSFDLQRHAMERGDITSLQYRSDSTDFFICFHVLEHIPDEAAALAEIRRVLKPGGTAVLQVPVDWTADETVEYGAPDPRDVNHVRRYGRDFGEVIAHRGFEVRSAAVGDVFDTDTIERFGLSLEPIFFATKPAAASS